ncbi:MAG: hypothetical protein WCJ30_04330 [Deltaproteobacteria bacterium]
MRTGGNTSGMAALASACLTFGQPSSGGGGSSGNPLPLPVPPPPGDVVCLDDATGACSDATEIATYTQCILTQCQSAYATCFGPSFASGVFEGDCKEYGACTAACSSCDATCLSACADKQKTAACGLCLAQQVRTCAIVEVQTGTCQRPCSRLSDAGAVDAGADAAVGAPDAGRSTGACMSLALCCNMLPPEDAGSCQIALSETNDVDAACVNVIATYKASGKCP